METKTVAAIEIASSKVKGALGQIDSEGHLTILAVEEISGINNVRYGRVQNVREVSADINEIIHRLEETPGVKPRRIIGLGVSLGGRSLSGVPASASLRFPQGCEITEKQVTRLAHEAARDLMGDRPIEATVPRVFYVNNVLVRNPVGNFGESFRGEFMLISCGKETRQNLDRIKYEDIPDENISYIIRPTAIADMVLTPEEKELGAAVVDLGAETTTVAVYKDGTPAFLCTIPMGARLMTLDLSTGLSLTEESAEQLKKNYSRNPDVANGELVEGYINARAGEIAANVLAQLSSAGFNASSLSGIVITGGGANCKEFASQLTAQGKTSVRRAVMPEGLLFRTGGRNNPDNIDIVALLWSAARKLRYNCLSELPQPEPEPDMEIFEGVSRRSRPLSDNNPEDASTQEPSVENRSQQPPLPQPERPQSSRAPRPEPYVDSRTHTPIIDPARRDSAYDPDDELLNDDSDTAVEQEQKQKKGGFFGRLRRNKNKDRDREHESRPRRVVEDPYDYEDSEDPYPEETDGRAPENEPASPNTIQNMLRTIENGFISLFSAESVENEDEETDDINHSSR